MDVFNVLVDTGSGGTIFSTDFVEKIGITPRPDDAIHHVYGVGGSEVVYMRRIDQILVGGYSHHDLEIEVGGMDYGFEISGILGMDFLLAAGAQIDLANQEITFIKN